MGEPTMGHGRLRAFAAREGTAPRPLEARLPGREAPAPRAVATPPLPRRYRVRGGRRHRHLFCDEAPRLQVRVRRDFAFSEAEARELGGRVILLDGAGSFGPLLDHKRKLYNLDHHQGCQRTFTLATCEQALLLVHGGLDLSEGDWAIYANEPDLDTLLALWCLLNHARLRDLRQRSRDVLLPMVRLEGAIDANGNQLAEVCGLPSDVLREAQLRLDHLLALERRARSRGDWQGFDLEAYTAEMLGQIDRMVYAADDFRDYGSVEEIYGHTEIGERRVAVVCRDGAGIYAVEKLLKERWGEQLGLIALEKGRGTYTLRRAAPLSDIDLNRAYELLNLLDRNVDGRPAGKRWGGSDNIGGSPRPTGSALRPLELLQVLGRAYQRPTAWQRLMGVARVTLLAAGLVVFGVVAGLGGAAIPAVTAQLGVETARLVTFSLFAAFASGLLSWLYSGRRLWLHGWRRPAGSDWLPLALVVVAAGLPARAWLPQPVSLEPAALLRLAAALALAAVAVESCFRGLVHGLLQLDARVQQPGGAWRLSGAAWVSAALYALTLVALSAPEVWMTPWALLPPLHELAALGCAAALAGLALASMRERSRSLWPGVLAQFVGGLACAGLWLWLAT